MIWKIVLKFLSYLSAVLLAGCSYQKKATHGTGYGFESATDLRVSLNLL